VFLFQRAPEGVERAVFKKLIAPFVNDLPVTHFDGFRRVCADHKYAYIGINSLDRELTRTLPCQLVQLPGTSYRKTWALVMSKNNTYKGVINWR